MFDTVKVGRIISQKRKERNMTQMQLADALGISFQAVSNWERGNSMPDISKLPELAELFGCSIEELLGGGAPAGNVEKLAKGEGAGLSLGELAEVAPVLTPEVLDEAVEKARRREDTPSAPCGGSSPDSPQKNTSSFFGDSVEGAEEKETPGGSSLPEDAEEGDVSSCLPSEGEQVLSWQSPGGALATCELGNFPLSGNFRAPAQMRSRCVGSEQRGFYRARRCPEGAEGVDEDGGRGQRAFGGGEEKREKKAKRRRIGEIAALAPFLSSARLRELVGELRGEGYALSELVPLAPFLESDDLDALVKDAEDDGEIVALAPFLSQEALEELALRGGIGGKRLLPLAPFLSQETLDRLVIGALGRGERIPRGLYPFLSERAVVEILKQKR